MDILLTHAYFLNEDPIEQRIMKPYIPLGILSISAYLEENDFSTAVFDSTFESLASFSTFVEEMKPAIVGIYINMMTKFAAIEMIRTAKENGAFVVVGGPEPPWYADEFLHVGVDAVVIGEGEMTVKELLTTRCSGSQNFQHIAGLVYKDSSEKIIRTSPRQQIPEIDCLPQPDRHKVDLSGYLTVWQTHHHYTSLSVITMRGCPYTCKWCSHAVYGESYRRRSPRLVVDELKHLTSGYHPDQFWFADDVFTMNHKWFFDFEKELQKNNVSILYECITRADRLNEDVIRSMAATGCKRVWIGSESGSQRILDAMSRGVTVEQIRSMSNLAQKYGIEVGMFFMLGYPGETKSDIERTIKHVKRIRPDLVLTTIAYPIKGTTFYNEALSQLHVPSLPFDEWNDRMIDIAGRYSKRFYWFANRRVANEAAWSRSIRTPKRKWSTITSSFLKAKAAQAGMYLFN